MEIKWKWRINKNNRENIQIQFLCFLSAKAKILHYIYFDLNKAEKCEIDCIEIKFSTFLCEIKDDIKMWRKVSE